MLTALGGRRNEVMRALLLIGGCLACGLLTACVGNPSQQMAFSCWPDQHVAPNVSFPAKKDAAGYYVCN
jgi:hypothetical protein